MKLQTDKIRGLLRCNCHLYQRCKQPGWKFDVEVTSPADSLRIISRLNTTVEDEVREDSRRRS